MPEGLPIDYSKSLNGTMAPYATQLLICTGKDDWPSRIEDAEGGDNLAADVKELVGRGGDFSDVITPFPACFSSFVFELGFVNYNFGDNG